MLSRHRFVNFKMLLGLDKETKEALIYIAQAVKQSPTGAARYAIKNMARSLQTSEILQGIPQDPAQVENVQPG
jgi:predicted transcriptional regulator